MWFSNFTIYTCMTYKTFYIPYTNYGIYHKHIFFWKNTIELPCSRNYWLTTNFSLVYFKQNFLILVKYVCKNRSFFFFLRAHGHQQKWQGVPWKAIPSLSPLCPVRKIFQHKTTHLQPVYLWQINCNLMKAFAFWDLLVTSV